MQPLSKEHSRLGEVFRPTFTVFIFSRDAPSFFANTMELIEHLYHFKRRDPIRQFKATAKLGEFLNQLRN
jgi:hypothetical protein